MLFFFVEVLIICLIFHYVNNYLRKNFIDDFHEKNVFITGTDTGFGRELALTLDRQGVSVYAGCYTNEGADSLRHEASSKMNILQIDVTDNASVNGAKEIILKTLSPQKGLWALVNNAGIFRGAVYEWSTIEDYENTMDVNFYGIIRVTNAFLPLVKLARGRIVNILDISGRYTVWPGPYSCSKFAAETYTDALRQYAASSGVKVSIVEPGIYPTPMSSMDNVIGDLQRQWHALSDDVRKAYGKDYKAKVENNLSKLVDSYPLTSGNCVEQVVKNIIHAIGSTYPKARYVCGLDAHVLYRPAAAWMPDWLSDNLFGVNLGK